MSEYVPSFTIDADDPAFERVVQTFDDAYQTRFELSDDERRKKHEQLQALVRDGRGYQRRHGIGKEKLDLKKGWKKEKV